MFEALQSVRLWYFGMYSLSTSVVVMCAIWPRYVELTV